jgi:hypothetical protein
LERRQATDPRRTTGIRASDRDPSERVADPEPRRGSPPYRYKRVTALQMRAWRWHGGPSTHIRHTNLQASVGSEHCYEHDYWQRYGHGRASLPWAWRGILARASATNATVAQRCPIKARREILCGQSFGRPNSVCLTRCSPVGQLVTVARQGN